MSRNRWIIAVGLAIFFPCDLFGQEPETVFTANNIEVRLSYGIKRKDGELIPVPTHQLMFHRIHIGNNFLKPSDPQARGNREKDLSRLATTYYHRKGPVGVVLDKSNWFPGPNNSYSADSRMPVCLVGQATATLAMAPLPLAPLVGLWSEPPVAVLGLEVGTLASYARPFQHFHFIERNPIIIELSVPKKGKKPYFHFIQDALERGAGVRILQGEPRPTLAKYGGQGFYHALIVEAYKDGIETVHKELLTKEGIALCMERLVPEGVLCIHVSNRYYELAPVVADAAKALGLACLRGQDNAPWEDDYQFSSEWVMVARARNHLRSLRPPEGYAEAIRMQSRVRGVSYGGQFWESLESSGKHLWTDKGTNTFKGLYRADPAVGMVRHLVHDLEEAFIAKDRDWRAVRSWTEPVHALINALDRWVVAWRNGPRS
jgi:hypothetical protein